ncbi:TPA: hypothetical protein ACGZ9Q_002949 [Elizabethkingia anophelis]
MAKKKQPEYNFDINADAISHSAFSTSLCFNTAYVETNISPIDNCIEKINQLNLIHTQYSSIQAGASNIPTVYNLILLGYISAIESYVREIIRKIIIIDKEAKKCCEIEEISYGAALNYPQHLLPEVILEKASFASKKNIVDAFKKFLGLQGHQPVELLNTLDEFEKICHFRHCIVHRFGKLGSQNAIKFGLDSHSNLIEKPLHLDVSTIFNLSIICTNTVLVINKYLYNKILERTASIDKKMWSWDLRKDKVVFKEYYNLFYSNLKPHHNSSNLRDAYKELKLYHNQMV